MVRFLLAGLLGHTAEDDDMLAGVLAHELGHVVLNHHCEPMSFLLS